MKKGPIKVYNAFIMFEVLWHYLKRKNTNVVISECLFDIKYMFNPIFYDMICLRHQVVKYVDELLSIIAQVSYIYLDTDKKKISVYDMNVTCLASIHFQIVFRLIRFFCSAFLFSIRLNVVHMTWCMCVCIYFCSFF